MKPRFSLLTLLLLVAVAAVGIRLAMWGWRHYYEEHVIPKREIAWVAYAPGVVDQARRKGQIVLLCGSAECSIGSQWMEVNVFETPEVRKAIYHYNVSPVLADLWQPNPHMAGFWSKEGVAIVYPADVTAQGIFFDGFSDKKKLIGAIEAAAAGGSPKAVKTGRVTPSKD